MERLSYSASWPIVVSTKEGGGTLTELGEAPDSLWTILSSTGARHMVYTLDSQYGTSLRASFGGASDSQKAGDTDLLQLESFHALRDMAGTSSCSAGAGRNVRSGPFRVAEGEWMQRLTLEPPCLQHLGGLRRHFLPHYTHAQDVATLPPLAAALLYPARLLRTRRFVVAVNASIGSLPPRNGTRTRRPGVTEERMSLALEITLSVEGPAPVSLPDGGALSRITADRRLLKDSRDASSVWVVLSVCNPSLEPVQIRVSEAAPPGYRALWHTHTYSRRPLPGSSGSSSGGGGEGATMTGRGWVAELDSFKWWPALAAPEGPSLPSMQWELLLPPGSAMRAAFSARVEMLHREAQPADASRGSEIGAVLLQAARVDTSPASNTLPPFSIGLPRSACRTVPVGSPLLPGPFPDATMPFNVMTLVSTLLSFLVGSMINAFGGRRRRAKRMS